MNLRYLEYLRLVIDKGSFAAAANAAGVSESAVSQALRVLEPQLGFALFEKVGRKKIPTRAALRVAQRGMDVANRVAAIKRPDTWGTHALAVSSGMTFSAGMSPAAALLYGPTVERWWHAAEPDGLLHISAGTASELLASLASDDLDLVIAPRPRRFHIAGIRRFPLHTSTPVIYARQGHPLLGARTLAEIEGAGWGVTGGTGVPGNSIEEATRVRGLKAPRILVRCATYTTLLHLVAETDLLCIVPHPALLTGLDTAKVRPLRITEGLPQYEVSAFCKTARFRADPSAVREIVEALTHFVRDRQ